MFRVLVDTTYVHNSGGKTIVEYFLKEFSRTPTFQHSIFILDSRLSSKYTDIIPESKKKVIHPNEYQRYRCFKEILMGNKIEFILSFNNLPPIFTTSKSKVFIFFHNIFLLTPHASFLPLFSKVLLLLKIFYIRLLNKKKYSWIVQTKLVKEKFVKSLLFKSNPIEIFPLFENYTPFISTQINRLSNTFVYVATCIPSKNHDFLLRVWQKLASDFSIYPKLILSIEKFSFLKLFPDFTSDSIPANVSFAGHLEQSEIFNLYSGNEYLIYPSKSESFGLPLVEAVQFGMKIIAIDLPYLHAIIVPSALFSGDSVDEAAVLVNKIMKGYIVPNSSLIITNSIQNLINRISYV